VMMFDLNGFKQVNDTHGHLAGDEVLKQFATELRGAFRPLDDVGRWGGDEFIVVLDCGLEEARGHVERVQKWVFGDYTVRGEGSPRKLPVDASVGVAAWREGRRPRRCWRAPMRTCISRRRRWGERLELVKGG